jgi:hypothetical protein
MLGVDYLERGSVRIQIWNHRDGRWEVIQRKPRWAGPAGTPSPVRFEKQTFPNTREGLQSLMGVLRQRSSLPSRDHPAKSDEAQEGLESIAERQTTRPGPVLELLSKDEIEGPAEIENLTPLLSQFHCLPMRAGPYTATAFWNERGQWLDPEGRLYLALFFTSAVDLQHLEVEVFPRTSLEPPIPGVEELIRPQEEKESP